MLIIKHTIETTATPAQIWKVWEDAENWHRWDQEIEISRLDGPFEVGTTGVLKTKNSPLLKTLLTAVEPYKMFIQEAKLLFAKSIMIQYITQKGGKTFVTFENKVRGPLAFFYAFLIGTYIKKKIPKEMKEMLKMCHEKS